MTSPSPRRLARDFGLLNEFPPVPAADNEGNHNDRQEDKRDPDGKKEERCRETETERQHQDSAKAAPPVPSRKFNPPIDDHFFSYVESDDAGRKPKAMVAAGTTPASRLGRLGSVRDRPIGA